MTDRISFILNQISPTDRVLHIGCCSDEWQFDRVWKEGYALHNALADRVGNKRLVGIDINHTRLAEMARMGFAVTYGDAEDLSGTVAIPGRYRADVVVGEIIEHLTFPGRFLDAVGQFMAPDSKLILTTPNAFGFWSWVSYGLLGRQERHPEHTCWFTPLTLKNLLERHGWKALELCTVGPDPAPRRLRWLKQLPERIERLRPELAVVAQRGNAETPAHDPEKA